jgi:hypothetical protein
VLDAGGAQEIDDQVRTVPGCVAPAHRAAARAP